MKKIVIGLLLVSTVGLQAEGFWKTVSSVCGNKLNGSQDRLRSKFQALVLSKKAVENQEVYNTVINSSEAPVHQGDIVHVAGGQILDQVPLSNQSAPESMDSADRILQEADQLKLPTLIENLLKDKVDCAIVGIGFILGGYKAYKASGIRNKLTACFKYGVLPVFGLMVMKYIINLEPRELTDFEKLVVADFESA